MWQDKAGSSGQAPVDFQTIEVQTKLLSIYFESVAESGGAGVMVRLSTSPGYPQLTTGIPVGKPVSMSTHRSKSPNG